MNKKAMAATAISAIIVSSLMVIAADSTPRQKPGQKSMQQAIGVWEFESKWPARTSTETMTITKDAKGKYEGTWSAPWGENKLSEVTFENGIMKFVQMNTLDGEKIKATYEGTIANGKITGKGQEPWGEFTFEGTLGGDTKGDITGEWHMTITIPAMDTFEKMTITKNFNGILEGKWETQRGKNIISDVKFEDGKLTFTHIGKYVKREFVTKFAGTVNGDNIKGVFSSEEGKMEVSATRVPAAKGKEGKRAEPNSPAAENKPGY